MGCKPSSEVPIPPSRSTVSLNTQSASKSTEPLNSNRTIASLPDTIRPQEKSRGSSSNNLLSDTSASADAMFPPTPSTPPASQPYFSIAKQATGATGSPFTPPSSQQARGGTFSGYPRIQPPPSPTPMRRPADVDDISSSLGALSLGTTGTGGTQTTGSFSALPLRNASPLEYRMDSGPYQGCTVTELPKEYRKQISDDGELLKRSPLLHDALVAWASNWKFGYGRHASKRLADVPLYYINEFVIRIGKHQEEGQEDLYVALKFHSLVREPEKPGEHYRFTFGKHRGEKITDLSGRSYITWMKSQGIPCQNGYEDLAEAIEYIHRQDLAEFVRDHPDASTYPMPQGFEGWEGRPLSTFPEDAMRVITKSGIHTRRTPQGYQYPGMKDAVAYWWLVFDTNRWNWRRERSIDTGEIACYPPDIPEELLFPPTNVREVAYTGY